MNHFVNEGGSGERKTIEINPHLLAHTMKNAGKKRTTRKKDEDLEVDNDFLGERRAERKTRIRMNENLSNRKAHHRYERKSLLREYRKKQEELLNEGGGDGGGGKGDESLIFSNEGGESKIILNEGGVGSGSGSGNRSFKVNTMSEKGGAMNDFQESVQFMGRLEKEIMAKNEKDGGGGVGGSWAGGNRHTVRRKPVTENAPEYGCLKGGSMPTFRQWTGQQPIGHRTTQRLGVRYAPTVPGFPTEPSVSSELSFPTVSVPIPAVPVPVPVFTPPLLAGGGGGFAAVEAPLTSTMDVNIGGSTPVTPISSFVPPLLTPMEKEAQERARVINEQLKFQRILKEREESAGKKEEMGKRGKRKKTIRRKLHTGKINDRVSILIPNKTIRNRFHNMTQKIHQTSIQDIKKYLLKRGFIKVGSSAPHEILRKMYQDLHMLGGEIQNLNGENIVYNFKVGGDYI
jgi:hypothetical protein